MLYKLLIFNKISGIPASRLREKCLKIMKMKLLHTAVLLLFFSVLLQAQTFEVEPAQGNPRLRSHAARTALQRAEVVERMVGVNPLATEADRTNGACPPDFLYEYLVESGQKLELEIDTFGLLANTEPATVTVSNAAELQLGTANVDEDLFLTYSATAGFQGTGSDTVLVLISQTGFDTILPYVFFVKRAGRQIVANSLTVDPETITNYCLDNEIAFLHPKVCSKFVDWDLEKYDGERHQLYHFSSYAYPDTCIVYYSSRFPGVDTVGVRICDEWTICDTFKIPFIIRGDTIKTLPFFDDFSNNVGPYPTANRWLDDDVFVNTSLAKDPPSVGFATFDGLDFRGDVYNIINGVGDRLTSKPIDLSGFTTANNLSLRFFAAPKGYGNAPEMDDLLTLQFRNKDREWVTVGTYLGLDDAVSIDSFPPFLFYGIVLDDPQFFHKAFQFRFSAETSPGGTVDLWHVDYVRLGVGEGTGNTFDDLAITALPTPLLKYYTAMPWDHFAGNEASELIDQLVSHFYNHTDGTRSLNESKIFFRETVTGSEIGEFITISGTDQTELNVEPKKHETRLKIVPSDIFDDIIADLAAIPDGDKRNLQIKYKVETSVQGGDFFSNDTVLLNTQFDNYFAHDDGTAEWQIFVKHADGQGQQLATQFHANVDDSLRAVSLMFPHVSGDVTNQLFNLKIWAGGDKPDTSNLVFERQLLKPFYPNEVFDTLQGFTTYVLSDFLGNETPVFIPKGQFFVGIEQATAAVSGIPIGIDVQNACDCNWYSPTNTDLSWSKFPDNVPGALTIRAVFGKTKNTSNGTSDVNGTSNPIQLFPNPTTGLVNIALQNGIFDDYNVFVFNEIGQILVSGPLSPTMDLGGLANGAYFVQVMNNKTGEVRSQRIVLMRD